MFANEFFSRAVILFRDDDNFMTELQLLISANLPATVRHQLIFLYEDELFEIMDSKDSSLTL